MMLFSPIFCCIGGWFVFYFHVLTCFSLCCTLLQHHCSGSSFVPDFNLPSAYVLLHIDAYTIHLLQNLCLLNAH